MDTRRADRPTPRRRLRHWRRDGTLLLLAALVVLAAVTWSAGTALVVHSPLPEVDAILSLASHEWERLPRTAALAAAHAGAIVVLTEPETPTESNCHQCAFRAGWLIRHGVAAERIHVVKLSKPGTFGEAVAAVALTRRRTVRRLLVVTSPYHTRRALATFRERFAGTGIAVGIEPATATSPARPERWWTEPYDRAYVAYEWAAIAYYVLRYGVWSVRIE